MEPSIYKAPGPFVLETGHTLPELRIAYHTYGKPNAAHDNVVWVCHALTANSDVADWWPHTVEAGCCLLYTSPSPRDRQKSRMPSSA